MALPAKAKAFEQSMDPSDFIDFEILLYDPQDPDSILEAGEKAVSFGLALSAEAVALGLEIAEAAGYEPKLLGGTVIKFWLRVAADRRGDPAFADPGQKLGVEASIVTDAIPPRERQRTAIVEVVQQ